MLARLGPHSIWDVIHEVYRRSTTCRSMFQVSLFEYVNIDTMKGVFAFPPWILLRSQTLVWSHPRPAGSWVDRRLWGDWGKYNAPKFTRHAQFDHKISKIHPKVFCNTASDENGSNNLSGMEIDHHGNLRMYSSTKVTHFWAPARISGVDHKKQIHSCKPKFYN